MTGKGKVSLSFNNSGKQPRRHSFTDSRDFVWDSRDLFGKKAKDEEEEEDAAAEVWQSGAFSWGLVGHTNPFLNYEAGFVEAVPDQLSEAHKRWSPKKTSRGTALARSLRGLGGSPKPVTSMESCLRAQMADALISINRVKADPMLVHHRMNSQVADALISDRASRPLYISSTVAEEEDGMDYNTPPSSPSVGDESGSKPTQTGLPVLPNLSTFLKEYAAKLSITDGSSKSGTPSRRRARGNNQASNDSNCKETLLLPVLKKQKVSHSWHFLSERHDPGLDRILSRGIP